MKKLLRLFGIFILLLVLAHVALNLIWGMQLRNTIRDLKAQGKLKTWDEIKPPPVPDNENAAKLYEKAFVLITSGPGGKTFVSGKSNWSHNDTIKTFYRLGLTDSALVADNGKKLLTLVNSADMKKFYTLITEASNKSKCNFNIPYENPWWSERFYQPYFLMEEVSVALLVKIKLQAQSGSMNEAMQTLLTGFKVCSHLAQEPSFNAQVTRALCSKLLMETMQKILYANTAAPEKIMPVIAELEKQADIEPFYNAYYARIAGWNAFIEATLSGRFNLRDSFRQDGVIPLPKALYASKFSLPFFKKDMQSLVMFLSDQQELIKLPYYKASKKIQEKIILKKFPKYGIVPNFLMGNEKQYFLFIQNFFPEIETARVGLALKLYKKEHGEYPEALRQLAPEIINEVPVDMFSGKNFVYKKLGKGFIIYSLGPNLKDDLGTSMNYALPSNPEDTKGDIVWKSEK